jgi:hypothetical protein
MIGPGPRPGSWNRTEALPPPLERALVGSAALGGWSDLYLVVLGIEPDREAAEARVGQERDALLTGAAGRPERREFLEPPRPRIAGSSRRPRAAVSAYRASNGPIPGADAGGADSPRSTK